MPTLWVAQPIPVPPASARVPFLSHLQRPPATGRHAADPGRRTAGRRGRRPAAQHGGGRCVLHLVRERGGGWCSYAHASAEKRATIPRRAQKNERRVALGITRSLLAFSTLLSLCFPFILSSPSPGLTPTPHGAHPSRRTGPWDRRSRREEEAGVAVGGVAARRGHARRRGGGRGGRALGPGTAAGRPEGGGGAPSPHPHHPRHPGSTPARGRPS